MSKFSIFNAPITQTFIKSYNLRLLFKTLRTRSQDKFVKVCGIEPFKLLLARVKLTKLLNLELTGKIVPFNRKFPRLAPTIFSLPPLINILYEQNCVFPVFFGKKQAYLKA